MRKVFFMILVVVFVGAPEASAQWWPYGNSAGRVVAGNQAMVWGLRQQMPVVGWPGGYPQGGQVVCQSVSTRHKWSDIGLGVLVGAGPAAIWTRSQRAVIGAAAAGAGSVGLYANHEQRCYVVQPVYQQPVPPPAPAPQPPPKPPAPTPKPPEPKLEPIPPRLEGVEFLVVNQSKSIVVVLYDNRRQVLKPGIRMPVSTPDIRLFVVQPDGSGSFDEFELDLRGMEDAALPGWRIRDGAKPKGL